MSKFKYPPLARALVFADSTVYHLNRYPRVLVERRSRTLKQSAEGDSWSCGAVIEGAARMIHEGPCSKQQDIIVALGELSKDIASMQVRGESVEFRDTRTVVDKSMPAVTGREYTIMAGMMYQVPGGAPDELRSYYLYTNDLDTTMRLLIKHQLMHYPEIKSLVVIPNRKLEAQRRREQATGV